MHKAQAIFQRVNFANADVIHYVSANTTGELIQEAPHLRP
jgi:hypothetical protein